jgi:hypothetical protein
MNSSLSVLPRPLLALSGLVLDPPQALIRGGYTPDEWQRRVVCELGRPRRPGQPVRRVVVVTARQVGKTIAAAAAVASRLVLDSGVLVVVVSASEKQASEVARHVRRLLAVLGNPADHARIAQGADHHPRRKAEGTPPTQSRQIEID